jgi:hypothetical protein
VRFTSVGDEFLQPLFFTTQSLHPRVVFLTFSVCVGAAIKIQSFGILCMHFCFFTPNNLKNVPS